MLESPEPIDFEPLIKALQAANNASTFREQMAEIELALVAAEMNPKPSDFCEFLWALEMLTFFDYKKRNWKPIRDDVKHFFDKE